MCNNSSASVSYQTTAQNTFQMLPEHSVPWLEQNVDNWTKSKQEMLEKEESDPG